MSNRIQHEITFEHELVISSYRYIYSPKGMAAYIKKDKSLQGVCAWSDLLVISYEDLDVMPELNLLKNVL
jgi:hypothetical protein